MRFWLGLLAVTAACATHRTQLHPILCGDRFRTPLIYDGLDAKPVKPFTPPRPIPAAVQGHWYQLRVVVDSSGVVNRDSIYVCGVNDLAYARRVAETLAA